MRLEIVIDTDEIKYRILNLLCKLEINLKTRAGIKNRGFYIQLQESEFDNRCPRCGLITVQKVGEHNCAGLATAEVMECQLCGQIFDVVPDYDRW